MPTPQELQNMISLEELIQKAPIEVLIELSKFVQGELQQRCTVFYNQLVADYDLNDIEEIYVQAYITKHKAAKTNEKAQQVAVHAAFSKNIKPQIAVRNHACEEVAKLLLAFKDNLV